MADHRQGRWESERVTPALSFIQVSFSARKHIINLLHDPLGPLDARVNQLICSRTALWRAKQIVCRLHVQACKNRCHDSDHAFSAFVHWRSIAYSPFVRYDRMESATGETRRGCTRRGGAKGLRQCLRRLMGAEPYQQSRLHRIGLLGRARISDGRTVSGRFAPNLSAGLTRL